MAKRPVKNDSKALRPLVKCPTGIEGLDEITGGGLPKGRTTLVSGNAGAGKTLLGVDFIVRGATQYKEPGVFLSFEETDNELFTDVRSLHLDLPSLVAKKMVVVEHVMLERRDLHEKGDFNLEGLFVRLENAIESIGAKRVVLDSIESFFAGISDAAILRIEIKRLFRWLKDKKVTAVVTGEPGKSAKDLELPGSFTRHGMEEYVSDCIMFLDHRVRDQVAVRRVRIVKYRGSKHGTNEYPFIISDRGLSVMPVTARALDRAGTKQRISTGVPALNKLFRGGGYTRGSTILLSGTAGTGKTSMAAAFALASCRRGERCLFVSYEESSGQLVQDMESIGFHLAPLVRSGLLKIVATRPSFQGLEMHLLDLLRLVEDFEPRCVVIDPVSSLVSQGSPSEINSLLTRAIDLLKARGVTGLFTSLVPAGSPGDTSGEIGASSVIDTWVVVRQLEQDQGRRRTRGIYIVKSRGTAHSDEIHKLVLHDGGIDIVPLEVEAVVRHVDAVVNLPHRPKRPDRKIAT